MHILLEKCYLRLSRIKLTEDIAFVGGMERYTKRGP